MRDEFDSRLWNEHGKAFGREIGVLFASAMEGLRWLHRYNWNAPWLADDSCDRMI